MTPTPDRLRQPRTEAGRALRRWALNETASADSGAWSDRLDDLILAIEDEAASPVPVPTLDVDAQLLAMAMDIAMDTPILNTGLRRVDVVIREYARLAVLATPDTETP